jgi:hypothetical protein
MEVVQCRSSRKAHSPPRVEVREERASASYMLVKRGRIGEGMRTEGRSEE